MNSSSSPLKAVKLRADSHRVRISSTPVENREICVDSPPEFLLCSDMMRLGTSCPWLSPYSEWHYFARYLVSKYHACAQSSGPHSYARNYGQNLCQFGEIRRGWRFWWEPYPQDKIVKHCLWEDRPGSPSGPHPRAQALLTGPHPCAQALLIW